VVGRAATPGADGLRRRTVLAGLAAGAACALAGPAKASSGPATAPRVVTLDGLFTETLLALDLVPVATANRPLYEKLTARPPLPASVEDLGPLQEPNLEYLKLLAPDLIVAATWQAQTQPALARIAPVAAYPIVAGALDPLENLRAVTRGLAERVGLRPGAEALIEATERAIETARAALAGRTRRPVTICRLREDGRQVALFGSRSTVGAVAARLGLVNAYTGRQSGAGTASAGIEDLAATPEAIVVHFDRGAETARALARLAPSPIWRALPAVRAGRVLAMPVVHPNGGLPSAARFAAQLAAMLPADGS
jgi:ferric hydroxamate transport system substrate-binding protein